MEKEIKQSYLVGKPEGLNLCVEDGKVKVCWKKLDLTKGLGLHTAFYCDEKLQVSSVAQWQVYPIGRDKVHIDIRYLNIPLVQTWLLTVTENDELIWDVLMQVKKAASIRSEKMGVFLSDKYTRWFHFSDEGEFPQGFDWEDVLLKRHNFLTPLRYYCFGVKPSLEYPGVSIEIEAAGGRPILQNTNEEIKGRALQFQIDDYDKDICHESGSYKWASCRIRLLEKGASADSYLNELGKRVFAAKSFGNDKLKLYFDERRARVYWQAKELTKHFALNAIFCLNDKWYGSSHADWQFVKIGEEKLHIVLNYNDIPVIHNWFITFTGANEIYWEVQMRVTQPVRIQHRKVGLFLSDEYTEWFNSCEEGKFSDGFNWENIPLNYPDSRSFGVKPEADLPGILFKVDAQGTPLLQNTNKEFSSRAVQFELRDADGAESKEGIYKWCSGRIIVINEKDLLDRYMEECRKSLLAERTISKDDLKLFFDKGQAKIYWKAMELTKNLGLYTTINVNDSWYDSSRAELQFKKIGQEKLYISIFYKDIPVRQVWLLTFTGPDEFSWEVDMEVSERLRIQHSRVSLFVSDKYTKWFNSGEEGRFPKGDYWQNIVLNQIDSRGFGVKPTGEYPGILLEVNAEGLPLIQNTIEGLSGRALQFELKNEKEEGYYTPGNYKYCNLKVKLIKEERLIDEYISGCKLLPLENENLYIFGDSEELHNRVAGSDNDFKEKIRKIKQVLSKGKKFTIKIGVSRFNFFRIKEMVEFSLSLLDGKAELNLEPFSLFPVQKLYFNFVNYLEEIKSKIKTMGIQLVSVDEGLFDLLLTVSSQANIYNERNLVRLLGLISEHAFIGPQTVVIDPHHRCNINCLHCWVHTPSIKHTREFLDRKLDYNIYKQMIDDFAELKVDSIIFQGDGEPLLYDKFFDMVKYARSKGIETLFFTNGLLLNKGIAEELVKLGVSQIFCSLPAATDKTYNLVTGCKESGAINKVLENLKYLTSAKRQANKINPKLIMTHVIHTLNHKEIIEMAENDVEIGADVMRFYLIRIDDNVRFLQLKPEEIESIKESMNKVKAFLKDKRVELLDTTDFQLQHYEKETGAWSKGVFLNEGCFLGWFFCLVPALGDISLCCHLRTVGYLKEKTFKEIWESKEYARYRFQAKYLKDNLDVTFLNGVKLYDEHCEHCDTHQVIRDIQEDLKNYNLERFIN